MRWLAVWPQSSSSSSGGKAYSVGDVSGKRLVCRYVRRDIRKLRDSDREAFFDAVRTNER